LDLKHPLYHRGGTWYEQLRDFPGGLLDPNGYVRYDSEAQFRQDSRLNIGQQVNVPRGIASHPRYQKFPERS